MHTRKNSTAPAGLFFYFFLYYGGMLSTSKLPKILEENKILSAPELKELQTSAECHGITLEECIIKKHLVQEDLLYKTAAKFYHIPYVTLLGQSISADILRLIPEPIAIHHHIIPYAKEGNTLKVALLNPDDHETLEFIEKKTGLKIELALTDPQSLKDAISQYRQSLEDEFKTIIKKYPDGRVEELAQEAPIIRIVDALLEHAILRSASDIHIEPGEKNLIVRFRVDGLLREAMSLPKDVSPGIIARVKILANLKIDEHRIPQDGRFKVEMPNNKVSIRVSIFPMLDGEKVVMRILHEDIKLMDIKELGFLPKALDIVLKNLKKTHGIILITGPTGSGKTTTLYTFISLLNRPDVNISTIEDPVEYRIPGINQSQVNPKVGFTFAIGLRSLLRQDPNIILVGEIRDAETADIAINAALTGHLVLSTLHTNDAVTAIARLLDLGMPPFLLAQTLTLITAQRLVRRICPDCIFSYTLTKEQAEELRAQFDMPAILESLAKEGVIGDSKGPLEGTRFFKGAGCTTCGSEGYRGRLAIHEVLEVSQELAGLVYAKASCTELHAGARKGGMVSLIEEAFIKAKQGLTTISEIMRVTRE